MNYPKRKMKSPFYVLQALIFCNCFVGSYLQADPKLVWVSNFNTDESDSWNITSGNGRFQRVLYSSILTPPQGDYWLVSAQGVNKELMPPPVPYYGGKIIVTFNAYVAQPSTITVRFLRDNFNYAEVQAFSISITSNGWNSYSVPLNSFQYPSFLVSFKYSSDIQIYLDAIKITIDGSIMPCPTISSVSRCGFTLDVFSNYGWSFTGTKVDWITTSAFTYLKRDFLYLGGLLKGSMNFKAVQNGVSATIQISVNQTSYQERINSGYTSFDLTASTQYTVGQTYTILITFITTSIRAQMTSLSMNVAGDMALCKCPALLTCTKLTNGVTCACNVDTCPGLNKQCIVSQFNQSADPCSCLPGYTEDSSGNCVGAATTTTNPLTTTAPQTTTLLTTSTTGAATTTINPPTTTAPQTTTMLTTSTTGAATTTTNPPTTTAPQTTTLLTTSTTVPNQSVVVSYSSKCITVIYIPFMRFGIIIKIIIIRVVVYVCKLSEVKNAVSLRNCYPVGEFNPHITVSFTVGSGKLSRKKRSVNYDNPPLEEGAVYVVFYIGFTSDGQNFTSPLSEPIVTVDPSSPCVPKACFSYKNQTCNVINSTYAKCHCKNGFISFDNGLTCEDIDECSSVANTCSFKNSQCTNLIGSSRCSCIEGYKLSETQDSCVDINECETLCKASNTTCNNTPGSYECFCNISGSYYNTTLNVCIDLNECSMSNQPCDPVRGICTNENVFETSITYTCSCPIGYELSQDGSNSCLDINECSTLCKGESTLCINTIGSFKCSCAVGFSMNSSSQCQLNNTCNCPLNSNCTINGSFQCTCNPGYSKNFMSNCQANDQCLSTTSCMKPHQVCQNIFANLSYTCLCRSGYEKVGDECKAINVNLCNLSSMNNISLCPFGQKCYDTNSGFECRCQPGYEKNNLGYCQDVNECEENISACPSNAFCTNTNGSYYCQCNKGFIGESVSNSSIMHCYMPNSIWSSWEQVGTCSMLCATDQKQRSLKFQRFCVAVNFSSCNDDYFKEEVCNSELCDNKIKILKSPNCENWSNMQSNVSDRSLKNNETWINKIRAWGGWKAKACGPSLIEVSKFVNQDIENITTEINRLLADRYALRKAIDCNAYIQRKNSLQKMYVTIYSRLAIYTAFEAALNKLKSRIDMKLNKCTRGLTAIYF